MAPSTQRRQRPNPGNSPAFSKIIIPPTETRLHVCDIGDDFDHAVIRSTRIAEISRSIARHPQRSFVTPANLFRTIGIFLSAQIVTHG
jgi:hypothetical protein